MFGASSELLFGASSELASVMEFGFKLSEREREFSFAKMTFNRQPFPILGYMIY